MKIIDVGSREMPGTPLHAPLLAGGATVIGFDYPQIIGDGGEGEFRFTRGPLNCSLLEPNLAVLSRFGRLAPLFEVARTERVQTTRLDDIPACRDAQYLKLDVQGAEAMVLAGATETLKSVLVVQTEVCFLPLYVDQPLFADLDRILAAHGFRFFSFVYLMTLGAEANGGVVDPDGMRQMLWGDAVYLRDADSWPSLTGRQREDMATIVRDCCGGFGAAAQILAAGDGA